MFTRMLFLLASPPTLTQRAETDGSTRQTPAGGQGTPTGAPAAVQGPGLTQTLVPRAVPVSRARHRATALGGTDEGRPQVLVDCLLGDPEGTTDPYGF